MSLVKNLRLTLENRLRLLALSLAFVVPELDVVVPVVGIFSERRGRGSTIGDAT